MKPEYNGVDLRTIFEHWIKTLIQKCLFIRSLKIPVIHRLSSGGTFDFLL